MPPSKNKKVRGGKTSFQEETPVESGTGNKAASPPSTPLSGNDQPLEEAYQQNCKDSGATPRPFIQVLFNSFEYAEVGPVFPILWSNNNIGVFFPGDRSSLQLLKNVEDDSEEERGKRKKRKEEGALQSATPSSEDSAAVGANDSEHHDCSCPLEKNPSSVLFSEKDVILYLNNQQKGAALRPMKTSIVEDDDPQTPNNNNNNTTPVGVETDNTKLVLLTPTGLQKKVKALVHAVRLHRKGQLTRYHYDDPLAPSQSEKRDDSVCSWVESLEVPLWDPILTQTDPSLREGNTAIRRTSYGAYVERRPPPIVTSKKKKTGPNAKRERKEEEEVEGAAASYWVIPYLSDIHLPQTRKEETTPKRLGRPPKKWKRKTKHHQHPRCGGVLHARETADRKCG